MDKENNRNEMSRRDFLRKLGMGAGAAVTMSMMQPFRLFAQGEKPKVVPSRMTYRVQHGTGEQISLLGFGMMRLPNNQEEVNRMVDYAIEHGVNYFDTAPMYMGGQSEVLTGNALSRHPREKFYVATKMSNQRQNLWNYNDAVNSHILPLPDKTAADYATKKKQFADGLREALPNTETWARSCADCEECLPKCPQQIRIPNQMARIVELLRQR